MMSPLHSPPPEMFQNYVGSNSRSIASTTKNKRPDPGQGPTAVNSSGLQPISSDLSNYHRILEIHKNATHESKPDIHLT